MSLQKRRAAAQRYKPEEIRLLLVAEAPPCAGDRYFYDPDALTQDAVFRYVYQGLTGEKPEREDKAEHLRALQEMGVFLIDLHEETIAKPTLKDLVPCVPGLVERAGGLEPERVALIKASVYDAAFGALRAAGLPVVDERIPYPGSGQQRKFLEGFARAAEAAGVGTRAPAG